MMLIYASLSDSCTPDRCSFSSLGTVIWQYCSITTLRCIPDGSATIAGLQWHVVACDNFMWYMRMALAMACGGM